MLYSVLGLPEPLVRCSLNPTFFCGCRLLKAVGLWQRQSSNYWHSYPLTVIFSIGLYLLHYGISDQVRDHKDTHPGYAGSRMGCFFYITGTMEKRREWYLSYRSSAGNNLRYRQHVQILAGGWNHSFCRTLHSGKRSTAVYRDSRPFLVGNDREQMFQIRYLQADLQADWIADTYLFILTDLVLAGLLYFSQYCLAFSNPIQLHWASIPLAASSFLSSFWISISPLTALISNSEASY